MEKANQNAKPPSRKINANLSNKEKMKQANREFAKRSRLRNLQECGELEAITISLEKQVSNIREEIKALLERCETLEKENSALMAELEEERGPEVIAELEEEHEPEVIAELEEEHEPEVIAELEEEHGPEVITDLKAKRNL